RWEISREGCAYNVSIPGSIDGDCRGGIQGAASEVSGVHQRRTGSIQLGQEDVSGSAGGSLDRVFHGEIEGPGASREVDISLNVYRDSVTLVGSAPSQVGGVNLRGAAGIELGHEGIFCSAQAALKRAASGKIGRTRGAGHVRIADGVDGDRVRVVKSASA